MTGTSETQSTNTGPSDSDGKGEDKSTSSASGSSTSEKDKSSDSASDNLKKDLVAERKRRQEVEKALKDKDLAGMEEGERLKAEHADSKTAVGILQKENADLKQELLKRDIAMELELPLRVAKRLQGETEEEMRADAQEFLKDLKFESKDDTSEDKGKKRPPNDAKKGAGSDTGKPSMNELLRIAAGKGRS